MPLPELAALGPAYGQPKVNAVWVPLILRQCVDRNEFYELLLYRRIE